MPHWKSFAGNMAWTLSRKVLEIPPLTSKKIIVILVCIRAVADYILDIVCGCFFAFIGFWEVVWYEKNKMERGRN